MLTLALLLAAQAAPQPGPIKTFGDWTVACDNMKRCEMTSLLPEQGDPTADAPQLAIAREPGPAGGWSVEIMPAVEARGLWLRIEGATAAHAAANWSGEKFAGIEAAAIVAAIGDGRAAIVTDPAGKASGRVSLAGTSAALRFIDAEQGRAGSVTAAVARGPKPASAVPAAQAPPRIAYSRPSGVAAPVPPAAETAMWKQTGCGDNYEGDNRPRIEGHALGGGRTLVLIPCGAGAYNYSAVPYVLENGTATLARFDAAPGWSGTAGIATLVNADFDARTGQLGSYAKGRGLGDCGSMESYVWDGTMFRLVEARVMGECRGSVNWLTVWRAEAVAK